MKSPALTDGATNYPGPSDLKHAGDGTEPVIFFSYTTIACDFSARPHKWRYAMGRRVAGLASLVVGAFRLIFNH